MACGELPKFYFPSPRLLPESLSVRLGICLCSGPPGLGETAGGEDGPELHKKLQLLASPQELN